MSARIVSVSGGSEGVTAHRREVLALADRFDATAHRVAASSVGTAADLGDRHLLESAAVAPTSFARVEGELAVLSAEVFACALGWKTCAEGAREFIAALDVVDEAAAAAMHAIDEQVAVVAGTAPALAAPVLLADPPLAQHVVDGLPVAALAAVLGGRRDGGVRVRRGPRTCARSPRGVSDLMERLAEVDDMPDGTIDVQTLTTTDGRRAHIVYLPGTDQMWSVGFTSDVRDLKENGRLLLGEPTAHAHAVEQALAMAGVRSGEPVLLVGHSQGGMQAAQLLHHRSGFDITNVVTAGSPLAGVGSYPSGSHVLSLENRADLVPGLDGAANPDTPEQVTVTFDDGLDNPVGSHSLEHYVDGARAVDATGDASVRDSVASLRPFFAEGDVTSQAFVMTRDVSHQG